MKNLFQSYKEKQEGSAMLITTIILLVLMVIVGTTVSISGMQLDLAMLNRNTSNTYYLAKSAVEKQVDTMNKAVESQMSRIIKEINTEYINKLVANDASIINDTTDHQIKVKNDVIRPRLEDEIYNYLIDSYKTRIVTTPPSLIDSSTGKEPIIYTVQSDRAQNGYCTEIKIVITDKDDTGMVIAKPALRVIATATTKSIGTPVTIYDQQSVEGIIEIKLPDIIGNQIHEKYEYRSTTAVPELLNSALLSFSDVVVSGSGELIINGDMRVSGPQNIAAFGASNNQYPEHDQNGGVIAVNGGNITVNGNLYTTNNVLASSGWGESTYAAGGTIHVTGDVIAYTVGIVDDFYKDSANQSPFATAKQVQNASITVGGNIMVDNDVMIDRWVNGGTIAVTGAIFGVNGGADPMLVIDPNQSSGIFSQGPDSQIIASCMYVAGQPYITLASDKKPLKLWESIGEPFDGIASFEGYASFEDVDINPNNQNYLLSTSPFYSLISGEKIKTDLANTFAAAKVSAIDINTSAVAIGRACTGGLGNQSNAVRFFYQGGSSTNFGSLTTCGDITEVEAIMGDLVNCYKGDNEKVFKNISTNLPADNFHGLRGYMTIMRSAFYKGFYSSGLVERETFDTALKASELTNLLPTMLSDINMEWSYETPICIKNGGEVDISKFYVAEGTLTHQAYPSIIINKGETNKLTIKASDSTRNQFKGIIISQGPVEIEGDLTINGTVIIGGPESMPNPGSEDRKAIFTGNHAGLIIKSGTVTLTNDSSNPANEDAQTLMTVVAKDHELYRKILDMLYITDYSEEALSNITKKQNRNAKSILKYSDKSILEVNTEGIEVAVKSLKKTQ